MLSQTNSLPAVMSAEQEIGNSADGLI